MGSYGLSDTGLRRSINQDSFITEKLNGITIGIVCDGIGGHKAGEVASKMACEQMQESFHMSFDNKNRVTWFQGALNKANTYVYDRSMSKEEYNGMGTTLVGFIDDGKKATVINCGDSRCYAMQNGSLIQITEDHTLLLELIRDKGMDYETACSLVNRNVISKAVGIVPEIGSDTFEVENFDYLLVCSDGLHGYVDGKVIEGVMNDDTSIEEKAQRLVELANDAGGLDNVTVIIYQRDKKWL